MKEKEAEKPSICLHLGSKEKRKTDSWREKYAALLASFGSFCPYNLLDVLNCL